MPIQAANPTDANLGTDSNTTLQAAAAVTTGVAGAGQTGIAGISESQYRQYIESKKEKSEPKSEPRNMFEVIQREIAKQEAEDQGGSSSVQVPAKYSNEPRHDTIITQEGGIAPAKSLENIIQVETTVKTTTGENINIVAPLSKFNQNIKDAIITPEFVENYNNAQIQAASQKDPVPLNQIYNPYSHGTTREIPVSERPGVQESVFKIYDDTGNKVNLPKTAEQTYQEEQYTKTLGDIGLGYVDFNNVQTFVDTYVKDPVGRFDPVDLSPAANKLFGTDSPSERIEQFKKYEGEEATAERAINAAKAPIELGSTFLPSFVIGIAGGAIVRASGAIIGKLGSSGKIGSIIANILTKPLITSAGTKTVIKAVDVTSEKKASSTIIRLGYEFAATHPTITTSLSTTSKAVTTPTNAVFNAVAVSYGVDVAGRINAAPTVQQKFNTAAKIAAVEIPGLIIGGKIGYSAVTRGIGRYETRGLTALKTTEYGYEIGIPIVKNPTFSSLQTSFAKNTYIPKPYKFSNTANPNIKQPNPTTARFPDHPAGATAGLTQYNHTTPYGEAFKKSTVQVQSGSSEAPGMYVAPAFNFYYAKTAHELPKSRFFITETIQTSNPATVAIYGNAPKPIPYQKAGLPHNTKGANTFMSHNAKTGEVYLPNNKEEVEGIISVGTEMTQLPTRFFFEINGVRVPSREFKISTTPKPVKPPIQAAETQTVFSSGSSGKQRVKFQYPSVTSPRSSPGSSSRPSSVKQSSPGSSPGSSSPSYSFGSSSVKQSSPGSSPGSSSPSYSFGSSSAKPSSSGYSPGSSSPSQYSGISPAISKPYNSPSYSLPQTPPYPKKKNDYLDLKTRYKPLRRETLHHLSIIDPAEAINIGSFTGSRKRPERIINTKDILYEVSGTLRTTKPRKR